jgi:hypothetical protein
MSDWLGKIGTASSGSNTAFRNEKTARSNVEKDPKHTILNPNDLTGDYDANRLLMTTLGGEPRMIVASDLIAFSQNAQTVKSRFKKGITAKQVIDLSRTHQMTYAGQGKWQGSSDIDKAKAEIRHAVPHSIHKGLIKILTPSGSDKNKRHHVHVRLLSWNAAVVSPIVDKASGLADWRKTALWVKNQPLKYDCDCGRHTFWFRYIATIGQYNEGRDERGFPKIRNPRLRGVACKHVLRVMSDLQTGHGTIIGMIAKALEYEHKANARKAKIVATRMTQREAQNATSGTGRSAIGRAVAKVKEVVKDVVGKTKKTVNQKVVEKIKTDNKAMELVTQLAKQTGVSVEQLMKMMSGKG